MKNIQVGRGSCDPAVSGAVADACGGEQRGRCTSGRVCECLPGWTGPHCLAHRGWDPIAYDAPDQLSDIGFNLPAVKSFRFLLIALGLLVVGFVIMVRRNKLDKEGWTAIPDANVPFRTKP